MLKKVIFMVTIFCINIVLLNSPVFSQEMKIKEGSYSVGDVVKLESKILNESRSLYISCPPRYERGSGTYPVIYVLDGDGRFPFAAGLVHFLSNAGRIPEFIVVALSNGQSRSTRDRDMTPSLSADKAGGTANFQLFMQKGLKKELQEFNKKNPK